jgi:hypothetical protein
LVLASFAILWALIYAAGTGRNWARLAVLVLFGGGTLWGIARLLAGLTATPLAAVSTIVGAPISITALVLLLRHESSVWFNAIGKNGACPPLHIKP